MAKQLNVNLAFTADTGKAKAQLQDLQNTLSKLTDASVLKTNKLGLTEELNSAVNAASQLKIKLTEATTPTGSLDLGKFNKNLKDSGKDLSYYANHLKSLGPIGQQAFAELAQSITLSEVPLKKSSKLLDEFATTMKNTIRWQFSSSMLHNFMGSISSAVGYAKDLNKSLNDIRIVTGQSTDQMADFAREANAAAKSLSATTTEYTNAALIYYQQGLSDEEVKARTDLTIKMANASGQSAEVVSDQLTAIWNNYAEGADNLEHFADVLTKLGAETASSSEEISIGLEKFAAIGDTIGLSYDNAAAALATVTATTRQSAEVVGTAFKTIFARIQGLNLGETLDDGTSLNKYSEALSKVGISIFEQNGEIKKMDNILDEMGAKWQTMNKDQQIALAQTVAGVRQYTQLVALMDNWDFYEQNLSSAQNADGSLQKQADIYAESWEAASDRVRAASERIYQTLLDDDAFIEVLNVTEDIITGFGDIIDAVGGLRGVLPIVMSLMSKTFGDDIANSIDRIAYNIKLSSKTGREEILDLRKKVIEATREIYDDGSPEGAARVELGKQSATLQEKLLNKTLDLESVNKALTEEEREQAKALLDKNKLLSEQYLTLTKIIEKKKSDTDNLVKKASRDRDLDKFSVVANNQVYSGKDDFKKVVKEAGNLYNVYRQNQKIVSDYEKAIVSLNSKTDKESESFKNLQKRLIELGKAAESVGENIDTNLEDNLKNLATAAKAGDIKAMQDAFYNIVIAEEEAGTQAAEMFDIIRIGAEQAGVNMKTFGPLLDQIEKSFEDTGALTEEQIQLFANLGFQIDSAGNIIKGFTGKVATIGDVVSSTTQALTSLASGLTQAYQAGQNLFDPDIDGFQKFTSAIFLATSAIDTFKKVNEASKIVEEFYIAVKAKRTAAEVASTVATAAGTIANQAENLSLKKNNAELTKNITLLTIKEALKGNVAKLIAAAAVATMGLAFAYGNSEKQAKKLTEELKENAEASLKNAEASREAEKENKSNLQSMNELLSVYEKTGEGKENLDQISRTLADAYNIEGAALASLTGEYEDYKKVSDAAYEAHKRELEERLKTEKKSLNDQANVLTNSIKTSDSANSVRGNIVNTSFNGFGAEELEINKYLKEKLGDYSHNTEAQWSIDFNLDLNNLEEFIDYYDKINEAYSDLSGGLVDGIDQETLSKSGLYEDMGAWLKSMSEDVEKYRKNLEEVNNIEIQLGKVGEQEGFADQLEKVSTLEEYQAWVKKVSIAHKEAKLPAEDLKKTINTLTSNSFNPLIKSLKASDDAFNQVSEASGTSKEKLLEMYNSLETDKEKELFWKINFKLNEESYDEQLELLKQKAEYEELQVGLDAVTTAQGSLKKNMSQDDWDKVENSGIDWGNEEEGIIEYSDFIAKTYEEQLEYLQLLESDYREELLKTANDINISSEERLEQIEKEKEALKEKLKLLEEDKKANLEALGENESEDNLKERERIKQQEAEIVLETANLDEEKKKIEDELQDVNAEVEIDLKIEAQKEIENLTKQFEKIENSVNPLVDIFENIGKGIKKTFDESGNSVWSFSREAVDAINKVYPGFMSNLNLLKDGTFAVTEEMYQAILDTENGALAANTNTTAGKLQNLATEAYKKAEYYESAAQAAYALAKNEVKTDTEKAEAKATVLEAVQQNEKTADENIIKMTEDTLGQQLDAENQYRDAIEGTSTYQSESTAEAANNVAHNTAAGANAALINLKAIKNAAYTTAKQVSQIGAEAIEDLKFENEALQWNATDVQVNINAADSTSVDSLQKTVGEQLDLNVEDGISGDEESAIYQALGDSLSKVAAQYRQAGDSATRALSELFESMYQAEEDLGKSLKGDGGGGDSKKAVEELEEYAERYHEITERIKMYERILDDISKAKDRAFGKDKIALIDQEIEAVKNLEQEQENLLKAQTKFLIDDRAAVSANFNNAQFDEYGNISNYTDLMTGITKELNDAKNIFNNSSQSEADKEALKNAEELYEKKVKILETYEETLNEQKEQEQILRDLENQLQDLNYEKLTYKLELEMIINDNEMKELDYYFGKMEGDIEKAVEAFGILQDKLDVTSEKLFDYEDHFNSLEQAYAAGQISQADYIAGLQECYDALYDNIEALNNLDKQMMEYYGETYDLALEKIETYTSQMEHLSSVLDHYKSIMSLLGKESDFETMGVIIEGQVKVAEDSYKSSKSIYELAKEQKEAAYEELMSAENDAERELLQKNYDKALEEFNNAQETMLTDAETYGELIKEALVNSMNQAAKEMEKALTGVWGSFESLQEQMSLHSEREEEYLTNTNKLYETNKMLNQIAQDMEKTDNRASKAKYQAFSKEIEQLQEKDKLSKLELEIAQAKYNLLQAQIALEEAQNAKSMVRLTRDEEGNYGYVYTADQEKISQAEQDLADAENDLYNIRLDAANEYGEKIIQAKADLTEKLKELDERAAEDEEYRLNQYNADKERIMNEYYATIGAYSELYGIATGEDARVVEDAWTTAYQEIINQGEDWKNAIIDYNNKIILSFEEWEAKSNLLTEAIAEDIKDITDASENLKNTLVEDVIPAMADTLDEVRTLTAEYALQRESVLDLADAYGVLAGNIKEAIREEAQKAKNTNNELESVDTTKDPNAQLQETRPAEAGPGSSSSSSSSGGDGVLNVGDEVTFTGGVYYNDSEGGGPTGSRGPGKKVRVDRIKPGSNYPIHVISGDSAFGWLREDQLSGFNTGGYTGEWGTEGKLALLHEKELVLNAVDTENLLASVQILRELTKAIDLNATWASMGIGSLNAVGVGDTSTTLEQKVEIHAEFPNATDHNEIEEAFNTLINRASQYANRF